MSNKIQINSIIRSKRRTLAIEITRDAMLIVRAPQLLPMIFIEQFIQKKQRWICRTQEYVRRKHHHTVPKKYANGTMLLYKGKSYRLRLIDRMKKPLVFNGKAFHLSLEHITHAREVFVKWYKHEAIKIFIRRVHHFASVHRLNYRSIQLTNAKRRWGSCSFDGTIRLNWALVLAPLPVIDYVVVHELAHLREKGHKKKFWSSVEHMLPNYKKQRRWLRDHDTMLTT